MAAARRRIGEGPRFEGCPPPAAIILTACATLTALPTVARPPPSRWVPSTSPSSQLPTAPKTPPLSACTCFTASRE